MQIISINKKILWGGNSVFKDKLLSSNKTITVVGIITLLITSYTIFLIPDNLLTETLKGMAQLNVTIAIGMGALAIALNQNGDDDIYKFMKSIIVFMMTSILCYFLSFWDYTIQRIYLWLSSMIGIYILTITAIFMKYKMEIKGKVSNKIKRRRS